MMKMLSTITKKKGQLNTMAPAIIALVFASVLLVFGLVILQEIRDVDVINQRTAGQNGSFIVYDAANATVVGLGTFADFWEIIVLAIVITIVIGLLLVVFGGRRPR